MLSVRNPCGLAITAIGGFADELGPIEMGRWLRAAQSHDTLLQPRDVVAVGILVIAGVCCKSRIESRDR